VTGSIRAARDKRDINVFGCNLAHTVAKAPADAQFMIHVNVITPFMPITSDGKEPDLKPFLPEIIAAIGKAVSKARRPTPEPDDTSLLPKRRRGRQSPEAEEAHREKVKVFCKLILQIRSKHSISRSGRAAGATSWNAMACTRATSIPGRS
jgi:DNA topoisomerase VI subunit B